MRASYPLMLLLAGLVAACAEGPFIDRPIQQSVEKPADPVTLSGAVSVCYGGDTPWAEVEALARETCAKHGYEATLSRNVRWHCRWTAPHRAEFRCALPGMVDEAGQPINPTDRKAVEQWRQRTGKSVPKPARPGAVAPSPTNLPSAEIPAAPPASPSAALPSTAPPQPALTPADIAGKPPMRVSPAPGRPTEPPPLAPVTGGFTLEPGSWSQHFEE